MSQPCDPQTLHFLGAGADVLAGEQAKHNAEAAEECLISLHAQQCPVPTPHGPSGGQAREHAKQTAEAAEEARRACIVDQERTRLLLAASHLRSFIPPCALTSQDRAALDGALAG